jgi:hypothetical protein
MTPKEKAEHLYKRFQDSLPDAVEIDKLALQQCALIAVDEIINSNPTSELSDPFLGNRTYENVNYWEEVKKEIESL